MGGFSFERLQKPILDIEKRLKLAFERVLEPKWFVLRRGLVAALRKFAEVP
jgi:hypothetical protein